jgi:SPP1 gp7 family putative phage head morphogenesis protein
VNGITDIYIKDVLDRKSVDLPYLVLLRKEYNNEDFFKDWLIREYRFERAIRNEFRDIEVDVFKRVNKTLNKAIDLNEEEIDYIVNFDTDKLLNTLVKYMIDLYLFGGKKVFAEFNIGYKFGVPDPSVFGFDITSIPNAADNFTYALQEAIGLGLVDERTIAGRALKISNLVKENYGPRIERAIRDTMKQRLGPDGLNAKLSGIFKNGYEVIVPAKLDAAGKVIRKKYSYTIKPDTYSALVARTESIRWANEGKLAGYRQIGVVKYVIFWTAMDENVCSVCDSLHGRKFTVDEASGLIPIHPRCRCTFLPDVDSFLTEKKISAIPEDVKIPKGVINIANENIASIYENDMNIMRLFNIVGLLQPIKIPSFKISSIRGIIKKYDDILREIPKVLGNRTVLSFPFINFEMSWSKFIEYASDYSIDIIGDGFYERRHDWIFLYVDTNGRWENLLQELIRQFAYSYMFIANKRSDIVKAFAHGFSSYVSRRISNFSDGSRFKKLPFYDHADIVLSVITGDELRKFHIASKIVGARHIGDKTNKILKILVSNLDSSKVDRYFDGKETSEIIRELRNILVQDYEDVSDKFVRLIERLKK